MRASLARELTLPAATALVVGQVIAVGIFLTPGTIYQMIRSSRRVPGLEETSP